jgi:hypothetical protein
MRNYGKVFLRPIFEMTNFFKRKRYLGKIYGEEDKGALDS